MIVDYKAISKPKNVTLVQKPGNMSAVAGYGYQPFLFEGAASLSPDSAFKPRTILRDTGAAQFFISADILPFLPDTFTGNDVLICGIETCCVNVPLHSVYLDSGIVRGAVCLAVR